MVSTALVSVKGCYGSDHKKSPRGLSVAEDLFFQGRGQVPFERIEELFSVKVMLAMADVVTECTYSEVLCHFSTLNSFHTNLLKRVAEMDQFLVIVKLATEFKTPCPCKDRRDRICGCRFS